MRLPFIRLNFIAVFCFIFCFVFASLVNAQFFELEPNPDFGLLNSINAEDLCYVANNTSHYLTEHRQDAFAVHGGKSPASQFELERVKATLAFICRVYHADKQAKRPSRLHDSAFMKQHFDFYRWSPDTQTAQAIAKKSTNASKSHMLNSIPARQIFLTKYYTKLLTGSAVKTEKYNQALYALPFDEQKLTLAQAELKKAQLTRYNYTRQQVINGALAKNNLAKPLVWITEEALHDVLLQGTGVLKVGDTTRYFNVHRNNGIKYDYAIGKREQARYWYFAEVPSIMGYGERIEDKIALRPYVSFAGNVAELGLGKLFMVSYGSQGKKVSQMGVLADQGGAFDHNLFQLDFLVDSYFGWSDYHKANKHLPDYASAWLLLVKE